MTKPGHVPITSWQTSELSRGLTLESVGPTLTSVPTLDYYHAPRPRRRVRQRGDTEALVLESLAASDDAGQKDWAVIGETSGRFIPDVAVASLGNSAASLGDDRMILEAIIGDDDRVRVQPETMTENPWRQICALRILSQSNQQYVGTAWFIGPRTLATAGHCVYLQDDGGWAKSIKVIPAKQGPLEPLGHQMSTRFASVDGWVKDRKRDFDYGVIFLDDDRAGQAVGNFEVRAVPPGELRGPEAQISGYPADRDAATFQYFHMRPLKDVTDTRLVYDIDTFGGHSGAPIWQNTKERGVIAVGIHTTGGVTSNSGTRITDDVLDNLISWTSE
jgi:glutamyl endopeptidase